MDDALHHDHVEALLSAGSDLASLEADVAEACAAVGLTGARLVSERVAFDVPVLLVVEVDACSALAIEGPGGVADLYVDLWGEAYGRSYGTRVRLVTDRERVVLLDWPDGEGGVSRRAWTAGLACLCAFLGRSIHGGDLLAVLAAAVRPPLREIWRDMARDAVGAPR